MKRLIVTVGLAALVGCSGSSFNMHLESTGVQFGSLRFPVSMSGSLVDDNGRVGPGDYSKVGEYTFTQHVCGAPVDLSNSINDQIPRAGGDAMVFLEIQIASSENCHDFEARGDIVKIARHLAGVRPVGS